MADPEYIRLHITPLTPSLLPTILPPSLLPHARNISYHTLQTLPEKAYGYLDLPTMDAEKLKKKLNGSILKGSKIRISEARPPPTIVLETDEEPKEKGRKGKKGKRKRDELPGVDIGERHVKRGWTTPAKEIKGKKEDEKVVNKSKFTTGPECLFRTVLPANVASNGKEKRGKRGNKGETLVHEFAKTTKFATFLRDSGAKGKGVVEFVEGVGWVDENGSVVEVVKKARVEEKAVKGAEDDESLADEEVESKIPTAQEDDDSDDSSNDEILGEEDTQIDSKAPTADSEDDSTSDSSEEPDHTDIELSIPAKVKEVPSDDSSIEDSSPEEELDHLVPESITSKLNEDGEQISSDCSSEDSSSEEESDHIQSPSKSKATEQTSEESEDASDSSDSPEPEEPQSATSRPQSSGPGLTIKIPDSMTSTPITSSVHPLEALYKRKTDEPKAGPSFSFFGEDNEDVATEIHLQVPLTPFTQKDFEYRGIRSAAPTPDTAHPNKKFVWPTDNDDDEEEQESSSPIRQNGKGKEKETEPESDFQKWFWENRGNVNRAWKKRRKVVGKEKRQRENRKQQNRAV